jgi:hypothetical protein
MHPGSYGWNGTTSWVERWAPVHKSWAARHRCDAQGRHHTHWLICAQVGTLRYVGMVTIILNDYPALKYVLVSIMGLFVLTNKEEA